MKKLLFAGIVLVCTTCTTFAQNTYISLKGGYGFNMSPIREESMTTDPNGIRTHTTKDPLGFGNGLNGGLAVGHVGEKGIGYEAGFSYCMSGNNKYSDIAAPPTASPSSYSNYVMEYSGRIVCATLALVVKQSFDKWSITATGGPTYGYAGKMTVKRTNSHYTQSPYPNGNTSDVYEITEVYSGGNGFGLKGSLSVEYALGKNMGVFMEALYTSLNYAPDKRLMTGYIHNGEDQLSTQPKSQTETDYVNSYTEDPNAPYDPNSPNKSTKIALPFSGLALNLGFRIYFN